MKNKKLLAIAALLLVFACAVLVACDNDVAKVEIALDKSAVTVEVGSETTISAIVTGSNREVVWTTDDESVATVNGGKIVGVKVGATVVKATVGDVTVDCNVTVTRPSVVGTLTIDYSSLSLLVGKTAEVNATVKYKSTDVDGLIYDWSVDGGKVCSVSADGKTATVKELTAGEATINVSTVHLGETLTESMSVVVKNDVSLTVDNLTLSDNKYILNLVTATPDGYNGGKSTNFAPMFKVEVDGKIVADAVVNVTVANADKAVVEYDSEQGEFVAKGVGSATISCVYTLAGAEYKVEILASVELPEVQLEKAFMLETGREVCLVEGIDGVATSVKIDGITVEFENTQQGIVLNNLADFAFGVHAIEVCTATEKLTAQVEIVTLAIANKADFDSIATV
uniref:Ig-like domain-containing protein n=1 Tax=Candidatus Fimenecus sp. TaxID=3022888 RepID=UPI004025327D